MNSDDVSVKFRATSAIIAIVNRERHPMNCPSLSMLYQLTIRLAFSMAILWMPVAHAAAIELLGKPVQFSTPNLLTQLGWSKRHAFVPISAEAKAGPLNANDTSRSQVQVSLFDDASFLLNEQARQTDINRVTVIQYTVQNHAKGSAVLSVKDGVVSGTLTTDDHRVFRIMPVVDGIHRIEELDHSKFPDCASHTAPTIPPAIAATLGDRNAPPNTNAVTADSGAQIDILVAYTQAAETAAGGPSAMQALIATAISETNTGYTTSGVNTALRLVHAVKVNYDESSGFDTALNALTSKNDGQMDEIHTLRDTHSADLVTLLIDNSQYCGLGWLPSNVSSSNEGLGFTVTAWNCATGYYSFGHEIGHNMGARHDIFVDSATSPYTYGHGYTNTTERIRSIMAYNNACAGVGGCTRVNHWSATDRTYNNTSTIGESVYARNNTALNNSITAIANYRVAAQTLTVSRSGTGSGTVSSNPTGINCGSTCSFSYNTGTSVTLTASAASGSTFAGWSGAGCTGTSTCTVSMSEARAVTATFNTSGINYSLSLSKSGTGAGTVVSSPAGISCGATCSANFSSGTVVNLSISTSGSTFTGWSGACSGTGSCSVTMSANQSVGAAFSLNSYNATVTKSGAGSGTVTSTPAGINCGSTCSSSFNHGTSVALTATPASGSTFSGWSGACSGTGSCSFSMSAAASIDASFALNSYAVTVSKAGTGSGSVTSSPAGINCGSTCSSSFSHGTSVTLTAAPASDSRFTGWSGACSGTSATCTISVNSALYATATFTAQSGRTRDITPILMLLLD